MRHAARALGTLGEELRNQLLDIRALNPSGFQPVRPQTTCAVRPATPMGGGVGLQVERLLWGIHAGTERRGISSRARADRQPGVLLSHLVSAAAAGVAAFHLGDLRKRRVAL